MSKILQTCANISDEKSLLLQTKEGNFKYFKEIPTSFYMLDEELILNPFEVNNKNIKNIDKLNINNMEKLVWTKEIKNNTIEYIGKIHTLTLKIGNLMMLPLPDLDSEKLEELKKMENKLMDFQSKLNNITIGHKKQRSKKHYFIEEYTDELSSTQGIFLDEITVEKIIKNNDEKTEKIKELNNKMLNRLKKEIKIHINNIQYYIKNEKYDVNDNKERILFENPDIEHLKGDNGENVYEKHYLIKSINMLSIVRYKNTKKYYKGSGWILAKSIEKNGGEWHIFPTAESQIFGIKEEEITIKDYCNLYNSKNKILIKGFLDKYCEKDDNSKIDILSIYKTYFTKNNYIIETDKIEIINIAEEFFNKKADKTDNYKIVGYKLKKEINKVF
jgi:hypothetical protein